MKYFLLLLIALFLFNSTSFSQEKTDSVTYRIVTNDDNQYIGSIEKRVKGIIEFHSINLGKISIAESDVKSITVYDPNSKQWEEHFQSSFYFVSHSGYGLKKEEGSYKNIWILFNSFNYGVSDRFSIGVGTIPVFLFGGEGFPLWVSPKFSIPIVENKVNIAAGALILVYQGKSTGLGYSMVTVGSRNLNFSAGLARSSETSDLLVILNGNFRISKKTYLMTENYLSSGDSFSFFGGRTMIGRGSIEYGIARTAGIEAIGVPVLGMTLPLHKRN